MTNFQDNLTAMAMVLWGGHCELAHLSVLYVSLTTQNPFWYTQNMHSWFVCLFFGFLPSLFIINELDTFNFGSGC